MICFKGSEKKLKKKAALGIRKDAAEDVFKDQHRRPASLNRASGEYHTDRAVAKLDYDSITVNFKQGESVKVMR